MCVGPRVYNEAEGESSEIEIFCAKTYCFMYDYVPAALVLILAVGSFNSFTKSGMPIPTLV